jgi:hypothetical protein
MAIPVDTTSLSVIIQCQWEEQQEIMRNANLQVNQLFCYEHALRFGKIVKIYLGLGRRIVGHDQKATTKIDCLFP